MNEEDIRTVTNERDASPQRWPPRRVIPGQRNNLSRVPTAGSQSYRSTSSSSSVQLQEIRTGGRGPGARLNLARSASTTSYINRHESHPTALSRIETHRTLHEGTVGSAVVSRQDTKPLPNFGAGKPWPPPLPEREEYVVEFDGPDDPMHAQNWPMKKKLFIGAIVAYFSLAATMGSSIFSASTGSIARLFGVSTEVTTLATSFFVLGYAFGPIMWAPMSELYGRRLPIIISGFGFSIFSIAVATAPNLQTVLISRFFAGMFGSCPLAVVGAIFADMFDNSTRGLALAVFSATVFMGPLLAPFIGGFIVISSLGWRWTEYISAIMGFSAWGLCLIFLEETYPPVILVGKASELRRRTKNWGIHAKQEEVEVDLKELLSKNISRPFRILFTEPIVLAITIYMSFIYGLLYLFLTAYAEVFQGVYGMNEGVGGLPYFGMVLGELIAFVVIVLLNPGYVRKLQKNNNIPVPEWRTPPAIIGGVLFGLGLIWFGWSARVSVHWIVPTLSGLFSGFGIFMVFLQMLNYIVDAYLMFAASAIAANTFLRSLFGSIFPLFATYMLKGMGIDWALTLLGLVALALVPMPIIFLLYGRRIRARSKLAPGWDLKPKPDEESPVDSPPTEKDGDGAPMSAVGSTAHPAGAREAGLAGAPLAPNPSREFGTASGGDETEAVEEYEEKEEYEERKDF